MSTDATLERVRRRAAARKRSLLIGAIVLLFVGIEVAFETYRGRLACVLISNQWTEPIEELYVGCGTGDAFVSRIDPGESAKVYLSGRGPLTLSLRFRQQGNGLTAIDVPGFDPAMLHAEGFKLVVNVRRNEYERYQEDADLLTLGRLIAKVKDLFEWSLKPL